MTDVVLLNGYEGGEQFSPGDYVLVVSNERFSSSGVLK